MDQVFFLGTIFFGDQQLSLGASRHLGFGVLIQVAVSVTGNGDGFAPPGDEWGDTPHQDGGAEYRAVQKGTDGGVGGFPQFVEMVLFHTGGVGSDGGAFYSHPIFFGGQGGVHGDLVICLVPVFQAEIVVFGVQINIREQQNVLDHLPDDPGHFIAVHLYQRRLHGDFLKLCHGYLSFISKSVILPGVWCS